MLFSIYLHGAYRHQELERRRTGKLPPALGSGGMLTYTGGSWTEGPEAPTKFKLFEFEDVTGLSDSNPEGPKRNNRAISRSHGTRQINDDALEDRNDSSTPNTIDQLPPLLVNEALAHAVSQVQVPMDGWPAPHIFRLFVVLVEPPPGIDPSAIEGLHSYLTRLLVDLGKLIENGIRVIVSHCWWALMGKRSIPSIHGFNFHVLQRYAEGTGCSSVRIGCQSSACSRNRKKGSSIGAYQLIFPSTARFQSHARLIGAW